MHPMRHPTWWRSLGILTVALFASSTHQLAAQTPTAASQRKNLESQLEVLVRLDRDKNGVLSDDEVPSPVRPFVSKTTTQIRSAFSLGSRSAKIEPPLSDLPLKLDELRSLLNDGEWIAASEEKRSADAGLSKEQLTTYAAVFMRNHDENLDGILQSRELKKTGNSWKAWDANADGEIHLEEVVVRFRNLQTVHRSRQSEARPATPRDFAQTDANQDGQIQMSEYSDDWNRQNLSEFASRDANQDGVITLQEWIQHQVQQQSEYQRKERRHD